MRTRAESKNRGKEVCGHRKRVHDCRAFVSYTQVYISGRIVLQTDVVILFVYIHKASGARIQHDTINTHAQRALNANRKGKYMAECKRNRNIVIPALAQRARLFIINIISCDTTPKHAI